MGWEKEQMEAEKGEGPIKKRSVPWEGKEVGITLEKRLNMGSRQ